MHRVITVEVDIHLNIPCLHRHLTLEIVVTALVNSKAEEVTIKVIILDKVLVSRLGTNLPLEVRNFRLFFTFMCLIIVIVNFMVYFYLVVFSIFHYKIPYFSYQVS